MSRFRGCATASRFHDLPGEVAGSVQHKGKYAPLAMWLMSDSRDRIEATFEELEEVLGFPLPPSARKHAAYWSGGQPGSTAGNAIRDGGWHARNLDVRAEVRALSASAAQVSALA